MPSFLQVTSFDPLIVEGTASSGSDANVSLAKTPDALIVGAITRDANGAILSASVQWPDGSGGTFTADTVSTTFPGAVDGWHITYTGSPAQTYTQPTLTRDANGNVVNSPAVVVH